MYFETWQDVLTMDGHGIYVWSVYLISIIAVFSLAVSAYIKYLRVSNTITVLHTRYANKETTHQ